MAISAGILMYRRGADGAEVLLVHPGGPFWARRGAGAWSIPKGEIEEGEDAETTARREFAEELGVPAAGLLSPLGRVKQKGGKIVEAFALEGDLDIASIKSSLFEIEWPPRSGQRRSFPEIDRAGWFSLEQARSRLLEGQLPLLERLEALLAGD